ncbi:glutamyl-tRNA reductase [Siphonobacter sp. BAB-5385]|uniref:glutamyl-tRNA reductase n=1 Tax=Siphonobacter sp. BAB-5385 TaxID=1864822 RepID=UPI000B9DF15E|nr:glutamyl-tRNA reductase [Siphonobacter sp. BAB-5385]OZI06174.1 glutamyl-tRNA reductase [Siphonobacter sp. BAB-5385]
MANTFRAISLSYKTAPLAVRELVALDESEAKTFSLKLKELFGFQDILAVSTCNRTEIYYTAEADYAESIIKLLAIEKGLEKPADLPEYFVNLNDQTQAIRHLFEVATGLHSQVVGDLQIPNQVKHSYQWAVDADVASPFLHRLMHTIFFASKRVSQETSFRDGAASVSYATVELIADLTQNHTLPKVLVVGLGEIGTDVVKNLADKGFAQITLLNRTYAKSVSLAEGTDFRVADWENLEAEVAQADVIVSSLRVATPLFTKAFVEQLNILTFKYFIDLSVPRSVAPQAEEVPGALVYAIDDIQAKANAALQRRLESVPQVHRILDEAMAGFQDWSKEMVVSPTIQKFKQALDQIRKEELARQLKHLTPQEAEKFDKLTSNIVNRILRSPAVNLKNACRRGDADQLADVLSELFDLERQAEHK